MLIYLVPENKSIQGQCFTTLEVSQLVHAAEMVAFIYTHSGEEIPKELRIPDQLKAAIGKHLSHTASELRQVVNAIYNFEGNKRDE